MANVQTGSSTTAVGTEDSRTFSELINDLMTYVGGGDNTKIRGQAVLALRGAVSKFNRMRAWRDRLLQTDITYVADQREYTLPTRYRANLGRGWLLDDDGLRRIPVFYKTYEEFLLYVDDETGSGQPNIYTVQNKADKGTVEVWPVPTSDTILAYPDFRFYYYAALQVPTDTNNSSLKIGPEVEDAIVDEAMWRLVQRVGDSDQVGMLRAIARESAVEAEAYDNEKRNDQSLFKEFT